MFEQEKKVTKARTNSENTKNYGTNLSLQLLRDLMRRVISENDDLPHLLVFLKLLLRTDIECGVGCSYLKQCFHHKFGFSPKALLLFSPAFSHSSRQHKAISVPSIAIFAQPCFATKRCTNLLHFIYFGTLSD